MKKIDNSKYVKAIAAVLAVVMVFGILTTVIAILVSMK